MSCDLFEKCNEKKKIKKGDCVGVCAVFYLFNFDIVLLKKEEYKVKYKKICFLCKRPKCFSWKFILDLITSLLNLPNLANIKTNRKINSWEFTINFG